MNKKIGMIVAVFAATLIVGAIGISMAADYSDSTMYADYSDSTMDSESTMEQNEADDWAGDENCTEEPMLKMMDRLNLTEEQEQEIMDTVISMRDDGADRDEIRDTVKGMLEDYGAELPGPMGEGQQMRQHGGRMQRSQKDMYRNRP